MIYSPPVYNCASVTTLTWHNAKDYKIGKINGGFGGDGVDGAGPVGGERDDEGLGVVARRTGTHHHDARR